MVERTKAVAPPQHTAAAASSTLCKLLAWDTDGLWQQVHSLLMYLNFLCGFCLLSHTQALQAAASGVGCLRECSHA